MSKATDLIAQLKPVHEAVLAMKADIAKNPNVSAGFADGARIGLAQAINQLLLHDHWIQPKLDAIATAQAALPKSAVAPGSAAVPAAPTGIPPVVPAS
jgi:hypothetical protein